MASDPGLAAMLLWTISLQALGTAGTNSNEGKSMCGCVCSLGYLNNVCSLTAGLENTGNELKQA